MTKRLFAFMTRRIFWMFVTMWIMLMGAFAFVYYGPGDPLWTLFFWGE